MLNGTISETQSENTCGDVSVPYIKLCTPETSFLNIVLRFISGLVIIFDRRFIKDGNGGEDWSQVTRSHRCCEQGGEKKTVLCLDFKNRRSDLKQCVNQKIKHSDLALLRMESRVKFSGASPHYSQIMTEFSFLGELILQTTRGKNKTNIHNRSIYRGSGLASSSHPSLDSSCHIVQ